MDLGVKEKFDELRDKIAALQGAVNELKETGINDDVLYLLIQKSSPGRIPMDHIRLLIEGIGSLEEYVFGEADNG